MRPDSRAWIGSALSAAAVLATFSCTIMPTAPRIPVSVEGRITGPSGEALEGALVSFTPDENLWVGDDVTRTDSLGLYAAQLHAGKYRVEIYPPAGISTPVHLARITFSSKRARYDFRFQGFRVTGRITGPNGESIDSGYVSARPQELDYGGADARLNHGYYSLLLPAGIYSLYANDADYWSGFPARWTDGVPISSDTTVNIQLDGIPISGVVVGPDGLPMEDVGVEEDHYLVRNRTRADGSYRLYAPPGTYRFRFQPPYPYYIFPRVSNPVTVSSPVSVDCDLRGVEWKGTIRRQDSGDPVFDATIVVTQVGDEFERGAGIGSGPQGEFRFILERDRAYDLRTYDPATHARMVQLQGRAATADTTFDLFIP